MTDFTRPEKKKRRWIVPIIVLLVAVAVPTYIVLNRWANSPNEQTISLVQPSQPAKQSADSFKDIQTNYFQTVARNSWRVQKTSDGTNPNRVHVVALAPSGKNGQIAITSDLLPSDQLSGVADYHLRTSTPAHYAAFTDASFPAGSAAFKTVAGPLEQTVFITHGGRYASISVSDAASESDSLALLQEVMKNWQWLV